MYYPGYKVPSALFLGQQVRNSFTNSSIFFCVQCIVIILLPNFIDLFSVKTLISKYLAAMLQNHAIDLITFDFDWFSPIGPNLRLP